MKEKTYSIEELASLTGLSVRTIRYYIQMGIADRPEGTRRGAWYGPRHLDQLTRIRSLTSQGFSLEAIRRKLDPKLAEEDKPQSGIAPRLCLHFALAPGLALVADRSRTDLSMDELQRLAEDTARSARSIREGTRESIAITVEKEEK